ncbi:MAG: protein-disulfide isomerase [Haloarculaceae archaeon]|jgi:protein-disulfide isomerase
MASMSSRREFLLTATTVAGVVSGCSSDPTETMSSERSQTTTRAPKSGQKTSKASVETTPIDRGPVARAPIPDAPDAYTYTTMGSSDASLTVEYYGNWKCPYCQQFSTNGLVEIVREYVKSGQIRLQFRTLAYTRNDANEWEVWPGEDAARIGEVGLGIWETDPAASWPFHETVVENQGDPGSEWATFDRLETLARRAGMEQWAPVERRASEKQFRPRLLQTARTAEANGISSTPTLNVDGRVLVPIDQDGFIEKTVFEAIDEQM